MKDQVGSGDDGGLEHRSRRTKDEMLDGGMVALSRWMKWIRWNTGSKHHRGGVYVPAVDENDKGVLVDLYIPRHCSATGRLITATDHASIQIQVADVDADGKAIKGQGQTIAICGRIRAQGDSDDSINRIATKQGLLKNVWSYTR
ncbi:hypothetical protein I302_106874 [Kwoniella bestiolae CBS 10118]|uniref:30S small subunit ribosomal protein S21e n=1 Tax=Kwoniella bestiolae CBS 10118 TaxID=1296100 RepID=A0AAJ8MBP6_9TREE